MAENSGGYIGNKPSDSSVTIARQAYTTTGITTDFTFRSGYTPGYLDAYLNGVRLIETDDYVATDGTTLSLSTAAQDGDTLELIAYKAFNVSEFTLETELGGNFNVSNNLTVGGNINLEGNLDLQDSDKILLGTGDDLQIYHDGGTSFIEDAGAGNLHLKTNGSEIRIEGSSASLARFFNDASVELHHNGSKKIETTSSGINITGTTDTDQLIVSGVSTFSGNLNVGTGATVGFGTTAYFKDNAKAIFGDGEDLQIYHDGSISYISDQGTGALRILSNQIRIRNAADTEEIATFNENSSVDLYYDNEKKFETTSTGSLVTGILTATDFSGASGGAADFPNGLTGTTGTFSGNVSAVDGTFTGNVSIAGTLTYEDVTNIDSVGLITARNGLRVTGGSVGINQSTPQTTFHSTGTTNGEQATFGIDDSGLKISTFQKTNDDAGVILDAQQSSNGTLTFATTGSERLRITKDGGVLIGGHTTAVDGGNAPNIEIVNTSTSTLTLARNDTSIASGNDIAAQRVWGNDSNGTYQQCAEILAEADGDHGTGDKPTALAFKVTADGASSPTERLRITSAGLVGINTTTGFDTSVGLAVRNGQSGSDHCMIDIIANTNETSRLVFSDDANHNQGRIQYNHLGNSLGFYANGENERLHITSGGNIGIGTNNPETKLHAAGNVVIGPNGTSDQYQGLSLKNGRDSSANVSTGYIDFKNNLNIADAHIFADHGTDGGSTIIVGNTPAGDRTSDRRTERFRIASDGSVGINSTNPTATLDVGGTIHQTVVEYPTIRPALDLNFAATKTLDRRITFTRDSVGTYYDELGNVKYASNNTPRFDHDPDTGESLGLLIEESRTNLFLFLLSGKWINSNIWNY